MAGPRRRDASGPEATVPGNGRFGSPSWPLHLAIGGPGEEIDLVPDPRREPPTVVALLSVDCLGCRPFWDDLASGSSVLEGRGLPLVVLERPRPDGLDAVGGTPVVVAPGFAEQLGISGRPAFLVVPDGEVAHAWCGTAGSPLDLAVVVAQVERRARQAVGAGPVAPDVAVRRSAGVAEVEVGGGTVLYDPARGMTLAPDPSTLAVWRALADEPAPLELLAQRVAAGRGPEGAVVALDAGAVVSLLLRRGWARPADDPVPPGPAPLVTALGAAPGPCCGDDHRAWGRVVASLEVSVGGQRRGVHVDDPELVDRLRARLGSAVVTGDGAVPEDHALIVGGDGGASLWHGATLLAAHADPRVLVEVLAGELERLVPPTTPGWAVDATAWIGPDGAVCRLGRRPLAEQPWSELRELGVRPVYGPVVIDVDLDGAAVVEPGPALGPDRGGPARRHPLRGWVVGGPAPHAAEEVLALLAAHLRPPVELGVELAAAGLATLAGAVPLRGSPERAVADTVASLLALGPPEAR